MSRRNFRLLFWGQGLSVCGTWMQTVGQGWLVLELSHSGTVLGLVTSARFIPVLLFGPWGGLIADRVDKRRLLLATQTISGALAAALATVVGTGVTQLWMVYALALALGFTNVFDQPARQSFVSELVPPHQLVNAVTLMSLTQNVGRVVGPAAAGVVIASSGLTVCFMVNAVSFVPVIWTLLVMDRSQIEPPARLPRTSGQLRDGFRYVWHTPELATPLVMVAVTGALAWEFPITLPLMAHGPLHGGAGTYGAMMTAMGLGAVGGGLLGAARTRVRPVVLSRSALYWGTTIGATALAPNTAFALAALVLVGYGGVTFNALAKTILQLGASPQMRGRVMALWAVAWGGSTPIGGPLVGGVGQAAGARWALAVGSAATFIAGLISYRQLSRIHLDIAPETAVRLERAVASVDETPPDGLLS